VHVNVNAYKLAINSYIPFRGEYGVDEVLVSGCGYF
jgi:hypothetical protein